MTRIASPGKIRYYDERGVMAYGSPVTTYPQYAYV